MNEEEPTITRTQAREVLRAVDAAVDLAKPALNAAPYQSAKIAWDAFADLTAVIAAELGLEILGNCEGCLTIIFDGDDHILTVDGCWLCTECRPSDEEMAQFREYQANCPMRDPECSAQSVDDHYRCEAPE